MVLTERTKTTLETENGRNDCCQIIWLSAWYTCHLKDEVSLEM